MPPTTNRTQGHQSHFVSFRVFVYRLVLPGTFKVATGYSPSLSSLLLMDPSEPEYDVVSRNFEDNKKFHEFLDRVRSEIGKGLSVGPKNLNEGRSIFKRIEITPLISAVQTQLTIDGNNSCVLTMADSSQVDFGGDNIVTASQMGALVVDAGQLPAGARARKAAREAASISAKTAAGELSGFSIRELDFVRVEVYSRINESWKDRSVGLLGLGLNPEMASTTAFTGLVVSINRSAGVTDVPITKIACSGMYSVLSRGTGIFSRSIAQIITSDGGKDIRVLDRAMNTSATRYSRGSSLAVFLELINDYFFIGGNTDLDSDSRALFMPDIRPETWDKVLTYTDEKKETRPVLVQFAPLVVCYHILKYLNLEPIVMLEDMLDDSRLFMDDPGISRRLAMPVPRGRREALRSLKPYLNMLRRTYELFDSSYMSPSAVIDEIRSNSFFEVFEDRSGGFRFRYPRYNMTHIQHSCDASNTIAVSIGKSDSAVFNVTQAQNMLEIIGKPQGLRGELFFDRFSIFRFGMRVPHKVENPNAVGNIMAKEVSRHISRYNSALTSRTATVSRILDPRINVGDLVRFEFGQSEKMGGGKLNSGDDRIFVGYVVGISESVTVSGESRQDLSLAMVRPLGSVVNDDGKSVDAGAAVLVPIRVAADLIKREAEKKKQGFGAIFNFPPAGTPTYEGGDIPNDIASRLGDAIKSAQDLNSPGRKSSQILVRVGLRHLGGVNSSFRYISDPIVLASAAGRATPVAIDGVNGATGNKKPPMNDSQRKAAIDAANSRVDSVAASLATLIIFGQILKEYQEKMAFPLAAMNSDARQENLESVSPDVVLGVFGRAMLSSYRNIINKTSADVSSGTRNVTIQFPGDQKSRVYAVRAASLNKPLEQLIDHSAPAYVGSGDRSGGQWYKSEFKRLFMHQGFIRAPGPSESFFTHEDLLSGVIIANHFFNTYLPDQIAMLEPEVLVNDLEAQRRVEELNNTVREMADDKKRQEDRKLLAERRQVQSQKISNQTGIGNSDGAVDTASVDRKSAGVEGITPTQYGAS